MPITFKRPMLAAPLIPTTVEHTDENIYTEMLKLRYPVAATLKMDGIRALRLNGSLLSRTLKPIPNVALRNMAMALPAGLDMELWSDKLPYDQIESIVMSREHEDSGCIKFHALDIVRDIPYLSRLHMLEHETTKAFFFTYPTCCRDAEELLAFFVHCETEEGEGICFRTYQSPYKQGRSTLKEQYLVKLSRYIREEVTIIECFEQMANGNSAKRNKIGMMDRSSAGANLLGKDTLGGFVIVDSQGLTSRVGTGEGLTDKRRKDLWSRRHLLIGKQITIKAKPHGRKNLLRSPVFVGFREEGF